MSHIETMAWKVCYDAEGSGPAMPTHGYGVTRRMWDNQIAAPRAEPRHRLGHAATATGQSRRSGRGH